MDDTASAAGFNSLPDGPATTRNAGGIVNTPEPFILGKRTPDGGYEVGSRAWFERLAVGRHPSTLQLARYFAWMHLPESLRQVSAPFGYLAETLLVLLPDGPELTTALRKLVESKDCAVRAMVDKLAAE